MEWDIITILVSIERYIISVFYEANKYSIHAEVMCINSVKEEHRKYIPFAKMYIINIDKNNKAKEHCIPCENCKKYIIKNKISCVYFWIYNNNILLLLL